MKNNSQLPKGWEVKTLGEVCDVIAGQSPEGKYYNKSTTGLPFYQGKKEFTDKFIGKPTTWTTKVTKEATKDDILMSVRAPVGPVNFSTQRICIGRGLAAIRANGHLNKDFLFNFLVKHENEITGNTGAVFNSINKTQIESIKIPIPPLPEQQRIVEILDKAFVAIDKAKQNTEQNLRNAKEVFENYLNNLFEHPSKDWEVFELNEICTKITDGVHKKPNYVTSGVPFIKINNLTDGQGISFNNVSYITQEDHELFCQRTKPEKGDILITKDGTIGVVRIIETDIEFSIFVSVALIKPKSKEITSFLKYVLISPLIQNQIKPQGAALKHLYLRDLRKYKIPIPPVNVQKSIVNQLDTISSKINESKNIYQQKISDTEELKKSILQKAFRGEL